MSTFEFVNAHIESLSKSKEALTETENAIYGMREFVQREADFPSQSQIEEEVLDNQNQHNEHFKYDMLVQLWNACKIPTMAEMFVEIRSIGQNATSWDEMSFNLALIDVIITNEEDFFDSECGRNNLPYPAVRYYKGIISHLWEGIHGWKI